MRARSTATRHFCVLYTQFHNVDTQTRCAHSKQAQLTSNLYQEYLHSVTKEKNNVMCTIQQIRARSASTGIFSLIYIQFTTPTLRQGARSQNMHNMQTIYTRSIYIV